MAIQRGSEVSMTMDTARGNGLDGLTRGSNRGLVIKLIKESESILNEEILTEDDFGRLETICELLDEKWKTLGYFDDILKQVKIEDTDEEIIEAADHLARILSINVRSQRNSARTLELMCVANMKLIGLFGPRLLDMHGGRESVRPVRPRLAFPNYESELPESREGSYPGYSGYQPRPPMSVAGTELKLPK